MQIDDIINKVFNRSFMGYDMREVDLFLDDIIDKLERYESERREMLTAMEYLLDKLERSGSLPEGKKALPAGAEAAPARGRGPRMIKAAGKERKHSAEAAELAAEAAVAVEMECGAEAPSVDELFPELLEALADMDIPLDAAGADEKNAS